MHSIEKVRKKCRQLLDFDIIHCYRAIESEQKIGNDVSNLKKQLKEYLLKKKNFNIYFEIELKKYILELVESIIELSKSDIRKINSFKIGTTNQFGFIFASEYDGTFGPLGITNSDEIPGKFIDYCISVKGNVSPDKIDEFVESMMKYYGYKSKRLEKGRGL